MVERPEERPTIFLLLTFDYRATRLLGLTL